MTLKLCQGPACHTYITKDRLKGPAGSKTYQTRRRSSMYYGKGNFCDQRCMYDWIDKHIEHALDHFGTIHEPKRVGCDSAWYKAYDWRSNGNSIHFFVNDLLGQRIPITEQQYNDTDLVRPN